MSPTSVTSFFIRNKWLLLAAFFFIGWKIFLVHLLWDQRQIPPVPDDSSVYISHIDATLNCSNFLSCPERAISLKTYAGVDHLTYRLFFGTIGKALNLDAVTTYQLSFYIGVFILLIALILFLLRLTEGDKKLTAFLVIILSLYNGSGSYHGFFWIVPSFFALIFFLLILSTLFDVSSKHWRISLTALVTLSIFTHTLGLYLLLIIPLYFGIYTFLTKSFDTLLLKKIFYIGIITATVYIPVAVYYALSSYGNPYGPEIFASQLMQPDPVSVEGTINREITLAPSRFPGWENTYTNYFRWIFPSRIGYIAFFICIALHYYFKSYRILCLYMAGLLFTLFSSLNLYGERSLIFLWPITYLLYGHTSWLAIRFLNENIQSPLLSRGLKTLVSLSTLFFVILSFSYSYYWNTYLNHLRNVPVSQELADFLSLNTSAEEKIYYSEEADFIDNFLLFKLGTEKPQKAPSLNEARWYITIDSTISETDSIFYQDTFRRFFRLISQTLSFKKQGEQEKLTVPEVKYEIPTKRFGPVILYLIQ